MAILSLLLFCLICFVLLVFWGALYIITWLEAQKHQLNLRAIEQQILSQPISGSDKARNLYQYVQNQLKSS